MRTKERDINAHERAMLAYIRSYISTYGYSPSLREMMAGLCISSTSVATYRLEQLESHGFIKRTPAIARGIALVKAVQS